MANETIHKVVGELLERHSLEEVLQALAGEFERRLSLSDTLGREALALRTLCLDLSPEARQPFGAWAEPPLVVTSASGVMSMHPDPWRFLADAGLLFEINRMVLHPVGLAIVLGSPTGEDGPVTFKGLRDASNDPEGIAFDVESLADGARKLTAWMVSTGRARQETRQAALGYITQPYMGSTDELAPHAKPWRIGYYDPSARQADVDLLRKALAEGPSAETVLPSTVRIVTHTWDGKTEDAESGEIYSQQDRTDLEALNTVLTETYDLPAGRRILQEAARLLWERRDMKPASPPIPSASRDLLDVLSREYCAAAGLLVELNPPNVVVERVVELLRELGAKRQPSEFLREAVLREMTNAEGKLRVNPTQMHRFSTSPEDSPYQVLCRLIDLASSALDGGPQNPTPFQRQLLVEAATVRGDIAKLRATLDAVGWPPAGEGELITEQASAALLKFHGIKPAPQPVPGTRLYVPKGWTLSSSAPGEVGSIHFQGETPPPVPEDWHKPVLSVPEAKLWVARPDIRGVGTYNGEALVDMAGASTGFEAADDEAARRSPSYGLFPAGEYAPLGPPPAPLKETNATVGGIEVKVLDPQAGDGSLRFLIGCSSHPQMEHLLPLLFGEAPVRIEVDGLPSREYTPSFASREYATWQRQCFTARKRVSLHFTCPKDLGKAPEASATPPSSTPKLEGSFAGLPFTFTTCTVKSQCAPPPSLGKVYRIEVELSPDVDHAEFTRRLREYSGIQAHDLVIDGITPPGAALRVRAVTWPGVHFNHRQVTFLEMPEQPARAAASTSGVGTKPASGHPTLNEMIFSAGGRAPKVFLLGRSKPYITLDDLKLRVHPPLLLAAVGEPREDMLFAEHEGVVALLLDASAEFDALASPNTAAQYPAELVKRLTCDLAIGIMVRRLPTSMGAPRSLDDLRKLLHPVPAREPTNLEPTRQPPATDPVVAELKSLCKPGETPADTFHRLLDEARQAGASRVASALDKGLTALLNSAINIDPTG